MYGWTDHVMPDKPQAAARLMAAWRQGCTGQSDQALAEAMVMWNEAAAVGDHDLQARAATDIGWYCFQLGLTEQGLEYARGAVDHWTAGDHHGFEARARAIAAWLLIELGCIEEASEEAWRALRLAERINDLKAHCLALNVVGVMFWSANQVAQGIDFCSRAVTLARGLNDRLMTAWWLNNLACAHGAAAAAARDRGDHQAARIGFELALHSYDETAALALACGDPWVQRLCLANSAEVLVDLGDYAGADQRLTFYRQTIGGDYRRSQEHYLYTLGQVLVALGRHDEAIDHLNQCICIADQSGNVSAEMNAALHLSSAYEALEHYDLALSYYKRYHAAYAKLGAERTQQRARLAEIFYQTDKLKQLAEIESRRAQAMEQSYHELQNRVAELSAENHRDPLTGLYNRRHLDMMVAEPACLGPVYTVLMIDLDFFKQVNDRFSHEVGDQVLQQIARLIQGAIRGGDVAIRYGGEEFIVMIRNLALPEAGRICHRLRQAIASWPWATLAAGLAVTVSIGVADNIGLDSPRAVLNQADRRLYQAKEAGRNRVVGRDTSRSAQGGSR